MSNLLINTQNWVYNSDNGGSFFLNNEELGVTIRSEAYKLSFTVHGSELIIDKDLIEMIEEYRVFHNKIYVSIKKSFKYSQVSGKNLILK